jgi:hypothetical protein
MGVLNTKLKQESLITKDHPILTGRICPGSARIHRKKTPTKNSSTRARVTCSHILVKRIPEESSSNITIQFYTNETMSSSDLLLYPPEVTIELPLETAMNLVKSIFDELVLGVNN